MTWQAWFFAWVASTLWVCGSLVVERLCDTKDFRNLKRWERRALVWLWPILVSWAASWAAGEQAAKWTRKKLRL